MPVAEIFTLANLLGACVSGLVGNRVDAGVVWLGSAGFNRLTGEASSEAPIILTAMHKCFVLSVASMDRACDSVGGDAHSNFARRALHDLARSKELRQFDPARHQLTSDLLEEQVRGIFGQQGRTPREAATERAIAIVEAGMGTVLTEGLREVFYKGNGRYRGWAEQFELFFAAEVSANQKLANILSLDRDNEAIARLAELTAIAEEHAAAIEELRTDIEDWFQRVDLKMDEILAAISALGRSEQQRQLAPAEAIAVIEEAARDGDLTDRQKARIAEIYGEYLVRTTQVPEQFIATSIASIQQEEGTGLLEVALRDLAGEDRRKAVAEREAELEQDVVKVAARFRDLAGFAALDSVAQAVRLFHRATDLDPTDFATWIELSRLHRAAGSLPAARKAAETALQHVADDWDRMLAENELGDIAFVEGDLDTAARHFQSGLLAAQAVVAVEPESLARQREVSVSHDRLGNVAVARGDLDGAERAYRDGLTIRERLAAGDPGNAEWQRDLAVSHNKLGDVAVARGDLDGAERAYRDGLTIAERLAAGDPGNAEWQRDLSVSHERLGDVARARGDLDGAERAYRDGLTIAERLAAGDPGNAEWQRDLSVSHERLGDVARARGDLDGAERAYRDGLTIAERLAAGDPGNAEWQRDLSVSHDRLGDVAVARGDLDGAERAYRDGLTIAERLAAGDPGNAEWQRDLFIGHAKLAQLVEAGGNIAGAIAEFRLAESILVALLARVGAHPQFERDLAQVRGDIARLDG